MLRSDECVPKGITSTGLRASKRQASTCRVYSVRQSEGYDVRDAFPDFDTWLVRQAVDQTKLTPEQLADWRTAYDGARPPAPMRPLKLGPIRTDEARFAVAIRDARGLWLALWVRRSSNGDVYVMMPRGENRVPGTQTRAWNPHATYHASGQVHQKAHNVSMLPAEKRQPIHMLKGCETVGVFSGHDPQVFGAICDPAAFTEVLEVPCGVLGPTHGRVIVDLLEPGHTPPAHAGALASQRVFEIVIPWIVITVMARTSRP